MTTTVRPATMRRTVPDPTRRHALAGGIFYLLTFAASIPAWILIESALDADRIVVPGLESNLLWAGLGDFVTAMTGVGTAVALYPVIKRQSQAFALGFVTTRLVEAAVILTGVVSLLAAVTLSQPGTGSDPASVVAMARGLVAVRDWTFILGPGFMAGFNAVMLGTVLYKSGLVPRVIPVVGLIGAPLLLAAHVATLFGHNEPTTLVTALATLPIAFWELGVGFWLTIKGFKPSPVIDGLTKVD